MFMSDDERADEVLELSKRHARRLQSLADTRCPHDGRLLGAAYWLTGGLWVWSAGHRQPPEVARLEAATFCIDALDECRNADEWRACYEAASEALSADIRPVARPAVLHVESDPTSPDDYRINTPTMSVVSGYRFLVTEVSCGCRRHFYLDLDSLILAAAGVAGARRKGAPLMRKHVPPLPSDLPEREAQRLLESGLQARA